MPKAEDNGEVVFTYHRPISITVTEVQYMETMRNLPQETLMTANLRLGLPVQRKIMEMIQSNLAKEEPDAMIALTVKGVS